MRVLRTIGYFTVAAYAPVSAAVLVLYGALSRTWSWKQDWFVVWSPLLVVVIIQATTGRLEQGTSLLGFCAAGILIGQVATQVNQIALYRYLLASLVIMAPLMMLESASSYYLWKASSDASEIRLQPAPWFPIYQSVAAQAGSVQLERTWSVVPKEVSSLQVWLRPDKQPLPDWSRSASDIVITSQTDDESTQVYFPASNYRSVSKVFALKEQSGLRHFRVTAEMRSLTADVPQQGCRGLHLQLLTNGGLGQKYCKPSALDARWRSVSLDWRTKTSEQDVLLIAQVADYEDITVEIRNFTVLEETDSHMLALIALGSPIMAVTTGSALSRSAPSWVTLSPGWHNYRFSLDLDALDAGAQSETHVQLTFPYSANADIAGGILLLGDQATSRQLTLSQAEPRRSKLWTGHPNLLAHGLVTIALLCLLLQRASKRPGYLVLFLICAMIVFTGSRLALMIALLIWPIFTWVLQSKPWSRIHLALSGALLAIVVVVSSVAIPRLHLSSLLSGVAENVVSRPEIWQIAWRAMLSSPVVGQGSSFPEFFAEQWSGPVYGNVFHAHNFWLDMGARFGIPGFIASLVFSGLLLRLAWRWGQWTGVAVVGVVFILNVFDLTLINAGVLLPLIIALDVLRISSLHGDESQRKPQLVNRAPDISVLQDSEIERQGC